MAKDKTIVWSLSVKVLILLLIASVIGSLFVKDVLAYLQGIILGGSFTVLKIKLMESTFKKAITKSPNAAKNHANLHYMLRYVITFMVLLVGVLVPTINIIAVMIALITLKIAAYWQGISEPKTPQDGSVEFYEWEDEDETDF